MEKNKSTTVVTPSSFDPEMMETFINMMQHGKQALEKQISHETVEADVENIIIPKGMTKLQASEELARQHEEEETVIDLIQEFEGFMPEDVFVAVKSVCEKMFGWVNAKARYTFFGKINPKEIQVQIDLHNGKPLFELCFFGQWGISAWDNAMGDLGVNTSSGDAYVKFDLKKKYKPRATQFFEQVREHLKEHSIYKGKCLKFESGKFIFIEATREKKVILNDDEELVIQSFVLNKIGRPGKSSVLFMGDYGTGKTETAIRIGAEAVELGTTFVYCKDSVKFPRLLNVMKNYEPACIFVEDVDSIGSGDQRDSKMNDLLNTLDGIETKGHSLMTIFTTNHENRINPALRRPGRIDLIVKFGLCEPSTVHKIFNAYFQGTEGANELDYTMLAGKAPKAQGAVIAEISKRSIDLANETNSGTLTDEIVESAIISMKFQIDFMKEDIELTETPEQKIVGNLRNVITNSVIEQLGGEGKVVNDLNKMKKALGV